MHATLTWIGPPHEGRQAEGDEGGNVDRDAAIAQPRDKLVKGRSTHGGDALWVGDDAAYQGAPTSGEGGGEEGGTPREGRAARESWGMGCRRGGRAGGTPREGRAAREREGIGGRRGTGRGGVRLL